VPPQITSSGPTSFARQGFEPRERALLGWAGLRGAVPIVSTVVGTHVRDLGLPRHALVAAIVRDDEAVRPRRSTQIESGDTLYVLSRKESRRAIERLFAGWRRR
jgi:NhaP-type Na+/H+ and K+/H+ antiporter